MSNNAETYCKTVNEMLRNDKLVFSKPAAAAATMPAYILKFVGVEKVKKGIQYALDNSEEIAKLEYENNDGQPIKTTLKHLNWAKVIIDSHENEGFPNVNLVSAQSGVSIGSFLLKCYVASLGSQTEFKVQTDDKRKPLVLKLFGNEYTKEENASPVCSNRATGYSCSQIIFDSADVASAVDVLLMNISDRTLSQWRIQSVFVQESLKKTFIDALSPERLNAMNNSTNIALLDEGKQKNEELAKKYGGKLIQNDTSTISLLVDVPLKYISPAAYTSFQQIPVAVNFFRTTKEAIQLIQSERVGRTNLTSIWTENISILYELAAEISYDVIWSNSIGVFDKIMTSNSTFNELSTKSSKINAKGKYAVHVLEGSGPSNAGKFLYIPFGKTFAN